MIDGIVAGNGNSRYLKSISNFLTQYPTYADFVAALVAGTLPIDLNGINPAGWTRQGTAINKANLLTDATAALIAALTGTTPSTPDEALAQILNGITANVYDGVDSTSATKAASANAVKTAYDLASKKLLVTETGTYVGANATTKDITVTEIPDYLIITMESGGSYSLAPVIIAVGSSATTIAGGYVTASSISQMCIATGRIACTVQGSNTLHLAGTLHGGAQIPVNTSPAITSWANANVYISANANNCTYRYYCLKDGNKA